MQFLHIVLPDYGRNFFFLVFFRQNNSGKGGPALFFGLRGTILAHQPARETFFMACKRRDVFRVYFGIKKPF